MNLKKKGVTVSFASWDGSDEPYAELKEVWVSMIGIPVNKITWNLMCQVASILGILVNVDWHKKIRSFYEKVKVQVAVRDVSKIPTDRAVEIDKELFLILFLVDGEPEIDVVANCVTSSKKDGSDDDTLEDFTEKEQQKSGQQDMETDKNKNSNPLGRPAASNRPPSHS